MTALLHGAALRKSVNFRKVDRPKPIIPAACRNCAEYRCDHEDRQGAKGIYFQIANSRCVLHKFPVQRNTVCDSHMFKHDDRRDA